MKIAARSQGVPRGRKRKGDLISAAPEDDLRETADEQPKLDEGEVVASGCAARMVSDGALEIVKGKQSQS